jgi:hypothetical protein
MAVPLVAHLRSAAFIEAGIFHGLVGHEPEAPEVFLATVAFMEVHGHGTLAVSPRATEFLQQILDRCRLLPMDDKP